MSAGFSRVVRRYLYDVSPRDLRRAAAILSRDQKRVQAKLAAGDASQPAERLQDQISSSGRAGVALVRLATALQGLMATDCQVREGGRAPLRDNGLTPHDVAAAVLRLRGMPEIAAQDVASLVVEELLRHWPFKWDLGDRELAGEEREARERALIVSLVSRAMPEKEFRAITERARDIVDAENTRRAKVRHAA
jgi:hypothetical protein